MALRRGLTRTVLALLLLAAACVVASPAHAAGAEDRVPDEVAEYLQHGLLPRLTELYAPGSGEASGIDFGESATVGTTMRLRTWTRAFLADDSAEPAVRLANEWVAPVLVGELVVGTALVWVNPDSGRVELAEFYPGEGLAAALQGVPGAGVLVRHAPSESWFVVVDDTATPLVSGSTGISTPVPLATIPQALVPAEDEGGEPWTTPLPALVLMIGFGAIAVVLLRPSRRRAQA